MSYHVPTREEAYALLTLHNDNERLIYHALAVEATMRHFAQRYGEDVEKWGIIGLVHDLDWGKYPEQHCKKTAEILQEENWNPEWIRAIQSHGWKICTDVQPLHRMEKVLYAIDELTGLITATVYMRPSKSILDVMLSSVKKKWKQANFAAGVNRAVIMEGAQMLNMEIDALIQETITAMQTVAPAIALDGSLVTQ